MKKLIIALSLILICSISFGQAIIQRSGVGNTVQDARLSAQYNFFVPRYADTTAALAGNAEGIDSCGAIIFTYDVMGLWFRSCSGGKSWVMIDPSGIPSTGNSWLISGNAGLFTSPVDPQYIGTKTVQGFGIKTSDVNRLIMPAAGLTLLTAASDTTLNKPMTYNTSTKEWNYGYWFGSGGGSGWGLTGNAGTTAGTNFVGTTDAVDLVLKSNAIERMRWNTSGALGLGGGTNYGTNGMFLQTTGNGGPPTWSESVTMANIGAVPNGAGATFSAGTLTLQPASSTFGGVVSSTTQTFTGVKTFASNIGIAGNAGASGDNQLIFGGNSTTFRRIYGSNSNAGNGAGVGMVLQNDVGNTFQYSFNSFLNLYTPDGVYIRTNGTGGYRFSHDGAGSKVRWSTSNAVGIESGAYLGWDANEFYHIAIPQAASTSAKTVLLYDTASGGYFSQISLDSIGGSGGAVAWNAITSPTADQALTFDAGESSTWTDANTTEDLFTVNSSTGTTNSLVSLNRTGTALASGNNILELVSSGANGTNAITATGARISVTNTNATSGTNVGLAVTASGATTANYAIQATGAVVPGTNNASDLGTSALAWRTGYFGTSIFDPILYGSSANLAGATGLTVSSTSAAGAANKGIIKIGTFAAFDEYYETMGIGLQNSVVPLHIKGSSTTYNGLKIENTNSGSYARQDWVNNSGDLTQMLLAGSAYNSGIFTSNSASFFNNGAGGTNIGASNAAGIIRFFTEGTGTANEKMRVIASGAVGINTTTPNVVNGTTFASVKLQISNASASSYITTNTDLNIGGTGILFNRSAASANLRLWAMDSQPDLSNTSSKFTVSSYTDAGSPTNMLTIDRNAIMGLRIPAVTTQYDNTTTTLGNVTGLSYNVTAAKKYKFTAKLFTTSDVAGGIKVAIGGTATATSIVYEGLTTDAGLTTQGRGTALGTAVAGVTAVTAAFVTIEGIIVVNASGTLTVQAAANAATGTTSVLVGSTFQITECL